MDILLEPTNVQSETELKTKIQNHCTPATQRLNYAWWINVRIKKIKLTGVEYKNVFISIRIFFYFEVFTLVLLFCLCNFVLFCIRWCYNVLFGCKCPLAL